jgi:hypothetical protein
MINRKRISYFKWQKNSANRRLQRDGKNRKRKDSNNSYWQFKKVKRKEGSRQQLNTRTPRKLKLKCNKEKRS